MNPQKNSPLAEPRQFSAVKPNQNRAGGALCRFSCIVAFLVAGFSVHAQDIFMRIGGQAASMGSMQTTPTLAGESTDPQYTNWIPVLSMSHGVSRAISLGNTSAPPNHQDFSSTKTLDKTSPSLNLLVNGATATVTQPIDYVTIDFRKTGTSEVYYRIELQGVFLTSTAVNRAADAGAPSESVSLIYTKIRWSYVKYVAGKAQTPITTGWDVAAQKAF
jgi:type VI secretion system Hcp family effector